MGRVPSRKWVLLLAAAATLAAHLSSRAQSAVPDDVASILTGAGRFTPEDLALLRDGSVVTKTEASPENSEAAVVTAVRIRTTRERTVDYFHQLIAYVDGQVTTGYGTFTRPPFEGDLAKLTLTPSDIEELTECEPSLCDVRIGAASPTDISQAVDWTANDAAARASDWVRQRLAAYLADYVSRGDAALKAFDAQSAPIDLSPHWRAILSRTTELGVLAPAVQRYLMAFPSSPLPAGATETFYWDKQHYTGLKPMIGLTHAITWREPSSPNKLVVIQRQIFASHYLYGSLAATLFVDDSTDPAAPATYVVYFNRARGDLLKGAPATPATGLRARVANLGATLQRRFNEQLVKDSAERLLRSMKDALER